MEVQQSSLYLKYIQLLGWKTHKVDGAVIIIKHFPLIGGLAKIQRPKKLPHLSKLVPLLKREHIKTVAAEPDSHIPAQAYKQWSQRLAKKFKINKSSYLSTKTIRIDLTPSEDHIFKNFSEAKRRAVRRALKNNVFIKESNNIGDLIKIKNKSAGLFGFITTYGIDKLWKIMAPKHAAILLAYSPTHTSHLTTYNLVGGILLLFIDRLAYYWVAGATSAGKKLFAPTLLVWEALKLSKKRGCRQFDFVGVWDERLPQYYKAWHGFTKFKEGFGGHPLYYPIYK